MPRVSTEKSHEQKIQIVLELGAKRTISTVEKTFVNVFGWSQARTESKECSVFKSQSIYMSFGTPQEPIQNDEKSKAEQENIDTSQLLVKTK